MSAPSLALLWHLHQPVYRRRGEASCFMPWVRLHALRSYHDMVRVLEEFPGVHVTINLVPCLVEQIRAYVNGASDVFRDVALRPVETLGENEKRFLLEHFFSADPVQMIGTFERYRELLERRNEAVAESGLEDAVQHFSDADYRDLMALFDLAWFGFSAFEHFPELERLRQLGSGFEDEDIRTIHRVEDTILRDLLPLYRAARERGQLEVSTTPRCHPILPLLVDTDLAREALPDSPLPPRTRAPERARSQVKEGLDLMEEVLGSRPSGMWPSEGSVSQEVGELLGEQGLAWAASDQDVLARSDRDEDADPYRPWSLETPSGDLTLVFRDHDLSDRVGFRYSKMPADQAVDDLLASAHAHLSHGGEMILVALDGENPWEHYPDAGAHFLRTLYGRLDSGESGFQAHTVTEAIARSSRRGRIRRLFAGSWIASCFSTWIGGPEKNRAWSLLGRARRELAPALLDARYPESDRAEARASLAAAEGSDWFWWLDGQFTTSHRPQFEELFRGHLRDAFKALGLVVPEELSWTVLAMEGEAASSLLKPTSWVDPIVNGFEADFFEWCGAERLVWSELAASSTMQTARAPLRELRFGLSKEGDLCLRIDPERGDTWPAFAGATLSVAVRIERQTMRLEFELDASGDLAGVRSPNPSSDGEDAMSVTRVHDVRMVSRKVLELRMPGRLLGLWPGARGELRIELHDAGTVHELRALDFEVPTAPDPESES